MKKQKGIVRRTAKQIRDMRQRGEDRTDHTRLKAMTAQEVEISAKGEGDFDWTKAKIGFPPPKRQLTMRLDGDVIDWFKRQGQGYQTRMNAVLRRFVEAQKRPQRKRFPALWRDAHAHAALATHAGDCGHSG